MAEERDQTTAGLDPVRPELVPFLLQTGDFLVQVPHALHLFPFGALLKGEELGDGGKGVVRGCGHPFLTYCFDQGCLYLSTLEGAADLGELRLHGVDELGPVVVGDGGPGGKSVERTNCVL